MNLLQSGFPLNTCSRGISDGQHVFSKPLFPSTSIIAVSIRSFTEKSVCASSFSKVALKASFFFVFVFVKGSLMICFDFTDGEFDLIRRAHLLGAHSQKGRLGRDETRSTELREREREKQHTRAHKHTNERDEKEKKKRKKRKKAQKTSSFSLFETRHKTTL